MGCCESTPDAPDEIIPDPDYTSPQRFKVKSLSMFNSDYEVLQQDTERRWLFLNKTGSWTSGNAKVELENFVRQDPENKKKGQVLWTAFYDETPHFSRKYDDDSSDDDFSDVEDFVRWLVKPPRRTEAMKWKMETKVTLRPGIRYNGQHPDVKIKVKAKGVATRRIYYVRDHDGNRQRQEECKEYVKKITYKVTCDAWPDKFKFKMKGNMRGGDARWKCDLFEQDLEGGFFSPQPHTIETKPGFDPTLMLLIAHMCAVEYTPDEIKKDFDPKWGEYWTGHSSSDSD